MYTYIYSYALTQSPAGSRPINSFWPFSQNELSGLLDNLRCYHYELTRPELSRLLGFRIFGFGFHCL
jgi:hypothetical protein